jgi:Spy/CpxP family protein refolding chaperone
MLPIRAAILAATIALPTTLMAGNLQVPNQEESEALAMMQAADAQMNVGKRAIVAEQLALTPEQAQRFWPVYDAHQQALSQLNRRRLDNILIYARAWNTGSVDDRTAEQVAKEAISVEEDEAKLLRKTFHEACRVLSTAQAARYVQLEAKVRARMRYEEAEGVPLVK